MDRETLEGRIRTWLYDVSDSTFVSIWNGYCSELGIEEDQIVPMDNFNDEFGDVPALNLVFMIYENNSMFDPNDDFYRTFDSGDLTSSSYAIDLLEADEKDALVDYIIEYEADFGNLELQDILNS